jgi:membrane protein implicated in regulation of membrane protease activity
LAEKAPQEQLRELKELIIAYFKQETIDPLKGLVRYVAFGLLGAVLMGTGTCFLAIGGLRALQTETGTTFRGNWSWAPYGFTILALLIVAFAALFRARSPRSSE